jgi:hypothetical protein
MKNLLLAILIVSCAGFKMEQNFVDIIAAAKHYFRSGCLYILHDEKHGKYVQVERQVIFIMFVT